MVNKCSETYGSSCGDRFPLVERLERQNSPESNWSMNSLIYFDLTKQGHVQQHSAGPLIINNDLSIIHKTVTGICGALQRLCVLQSYTQTHTLFYLSLACTCTVDMGAHTLQSCCFFPVLPQARIHKLKIVPLSLSMPHLKNPHPLSHQCVQMELCFLIEGVKWTASCRRTRLIRQWMPGETWRQTETVKRGCRRTLKRCSRLTP